ncbi:MAG: diguanylate cyclase [Gammaproteobacteria bacterium]|nr:diguanylate cyclase [Gammaproteobacteria bacterium]
MMKAIEHILIVDDDPNLRKTLADILRVKGYATAVVGTGAEAVAVAEQQNFSLALIDLQLPDMPGLEVMTRIKAISPLMEAIILTGHASLDTAIEATRHGAFSYLVKPYQMDDLLLNIRHAVERKQAQEEILRLASFPRLLPSPVIEFDHAGEVTYLNPAAERVFPELAALGLSHPLLQGLVELFATLQQSKQQEDFVHEAKVGDETYELHVSYVQEAGLIRIYVLVVTQPKRVEEEIHLLATTDSLTGIINRREFSTILAGEMDRARRYAIPLSLAMYDLDYFKRVNDTFGHDSGDYVLQAVTTLVKKNIRANDVVARWGGEEFMVLLPHSEVQAALNVAEKLRQAIAEYVFDNVGHLTASFGVVAFESQDDFNSLLKRVDDALYLAKQQGRNRVELLTGEVASK